MRPALRTISLLLAAGLGLATLGSAAALAAVGPSVPAPAALRDRIEIRLRPDAARRAWSARLDAASVASRAGISTARGVRALAGAARSTDAALGSLGLPALDRALARFGAAWLEPEFRGETPPAHDGEIDFTAFYLARWPHAVDVEAAAAELRALPEVASAEVVPVLPVAAFANDSLFAASWWFHDPPARRDVHAPEAWEATTGDTTIVVAVLDTGVLPYHPDLEGQIFTNAAEAAGLPGVDDDGNGFVDDLHGWDFIDRASDGVRAGEDHVDQDNDPNDFAGHGTAVAGVVGAVANNVIGVTGTAWKVRLMPLRIGWSADGSPLGLVDMSAVAQALRYAGRQGVHVANCSFATLNLSGLYAAADAATRAGTVIVAAAGNGGQPHDLANRADVIAVAATRRDDLVASFSNRGAYVDLAAPGDDIATTFVAATGGDSIGLRQPSYVVIDGTSFSAPMVAGGAVLVEAMRRVRGERRLIAQGMLLRLVETADDIAAQNPSLDGYGAGRLNLARAVSERPTSTATRIAGLTVGPPLLMPPDGVSPRVAYVTSNQRWLVMAGQESDTVSFATLPGRPVGQLAGGVIPHAQHGRTFGMFVGTAAGDLLGLDEFGTALPGWPVRVGGTFARPVGGPALGDLDGDGALEVVCGVENGDVHALRLDGVMVPGFPAFTSAGGVSAPVAIADLDGDGDDEIVAASADGEVHALEGDGTLLPGWPVFVDPGPQAPVITRFAAGEAPTIVVVAAGTVHALRRDGSTRFTAALDGVATQAPALGDLDGDGVDEIVIATDAPDLVVADSTGALTTPVPLAGLASSPPLVGPLTPGGREIVVLEGSRLAGYAPDGTRRGRFTAVGNAGFFPTLADVDGDGATEVLAGTASDSILYVYDTGAGGWTSDWSARAWLTPRGDAARTGSRDVGPPSPVRDLRVRAVSDSTVTLEWSSPPNEDAATALVRFVIVAAPDTVTAESFGTAPVQDTVEIAASPGSVLAFEVKGLAVGARYGFALVASDLEGNQSRLSNVVTATTGAPPGPVAGIGIAPRARPSGLPVEFVWRGAGAGGAQEIAIYDLSGRRVARLALGSELEGVRTWHGRDESGALVPAGIYFARLGSGSFHAQTRVVLLP